MFFLLLNMLMLDELSDSLRLIDFGTCLMIEGGSCRQCFSNDDEIFPKIKLRIFPDHETIWKIR